jgi:hypothetical protein
MDGEWIQNQPRATTQVKFLPGVTGAGIVQQVPVQQEQGPTPPDLYDDEYLDDEEILIPEIHEGELYEYVKRVN